LDRARVEVLRDLLASTGWVDRTRSFARSLRKARSGRTPGGLLVVGTPEEEPWHLTAHLDDEARFAGIPELTPTLVRWQVPDAAPPHLAVTMARLEQASRGETVFVVAPGTAPDPLLERVSDARKIGATVFAMDGGDAELESLAHDALVVPPGATAGIVVPDFDTVSHLVSLAAGEADAASSRGERRRGFRNRLARMLDVVSGPEE
jgi:hypothetical protein